MSDLPTGWEWARLGDLGTEVRGSVHPEAGTEYELYSVPTYPTGRPEILDGRKIGSSKRPVAPGDVLLCKINPRINRVWIVIEPLVGGYQIASPEYLILRTGDVVLSSYLRWCLQGPEFRRWIELTVEGATGSHTRAKSGPILDQPVPLPPRVEQERIVAAVEEHLSRLDASDECLRRCTSRSARLRQRVIDHALEGRAVRLGDHLREPLRNGLSARASATGSTRVVTLTAVTRSEFTDEHTKTIEPPARSIDDLWMRRGDVFVQRSNTPDLVGTAAMYRGPDSWAIFPDLLIRVRPDDHIDPAYLELALRSTSVRRYFRETAQGIAGSMPKISQPTVEDAAIPLPDRPRQRAIVKQAERRLEAIDGLERNVNLGGTRSSTLRRSILAAAFSGQLVPQDPDDEPASVLLERIAAERAAAIAPRRRKAASA